MPIRVIVPIASIRAEDFHVEVGIVGKEHEASRDHPFVVTEHPPSLKGICGRERDSRESVSLVSFRDDEGVSIDFHIECYNGMGEADFTVGIDLCSGTKGSGIRVPGVSAPLHAIPFPWLIVYRNILGMKIETIGLKHQNP